MFLKHIKLVLDLLNPAPLANFKKPLATVGFNVAIVILAEMKSTETGCLRKTKMFV